MDEQDIQELEDLEELEAMIPEDEDTDLDLDDILKEFAFGEPSEDADNETRVIPAVSQDTVALNTAALKEKPDITGDTVRLDALEQLREDTPEEPPHPPKPEKAEPYSDRWEPEYEQPIGEYVPPQPIVFQPRSRLRELKRKLVAGPEKRYYELSELGLGKLQLLMLISLLVFGLSAAALGMYAAGWIGQGRIKLMIFGQFFALLVSGLLGSHQLLDGLGDLLRFRFSLNSMLLFSFIACCADGIFCLRQLRIPCCAAFSLQVTMALWAAYHRRSAEMGQMDILRKANRLDGLYACPNYHECGVGILRADGEPEHFMDHYRASSGPQKVQSVYAFLSMLLCIGLGVGSWYLHDSVAFGVQVAAVSSLAATPVASFVSLTRPMAIQVKRLHAQGTVLCGWQGVKGLCKRTVFPVTHDDLFPTGACKLNGVKFYGSRDPDQVIAYAAALILADGGGLVPLFVHLLESRSCRRYTAQTLRAYGNGGIGGEVQDESVLVGDMAFLKAMGVEIPEGTRVSQAVYVAIDGEFCGLVAVTYSKQKSAALGLSSLCSRRACRPVLVSNDFMLTEGFIRSRFNVNTRRMLFPEYSVRQELSQKTAPEGAVSLALVTRNGLSSYTYAITGARALRRASILGVTVQILVGLVGLAMMAALAYLGEVDRLTPVNMLLYELVWLLPCLLITEWARSN